MDKTTNILKLCRDCGEVLVWEYAKEKRWNGRCPCGVEYFDLEKPERVPLPTEAVLLARIAELEDMQRCRVEADEPAKPNSRVLALCGVAGSRRRPYIMEHWIDKDGRWFGGDGFQHGGDFWWPILAIRGIE